MTEGIYYRLLIEQRMCQVFGLLDLMEFRTLARPGKVADKTLQEFPYKRKGFSPVMSNGLVCFKFVEPFRRSVHAGNNKGLTRGQKKPGLRNSQPVPLYKKQKLAYMSEVKLSP
jgi:hypothetical protein